MSGLASDAAFALLSLEVRGAVAVLTLRRPNVLNAFDTALILETRRALKRVAEVPPRRVLASDASTAVALTI